MATKKQMLLVFVSTVIMLMFMSVQSMDSYLDRYLLDHQVLAQAPTSSAEPHLSGAEARIAGLDAYVSGSKSSRRAVLLSSDVFGYKVENLRKIADKAAASGYLAVVPDFFRGDPYDGNRSHLLEWKRIHDPSVSARAARRVVEALKREHRVRSFGAAGFCFGAKIATELAKMKVVKGIVLLHPTDINATDVERVEKPIAIFLGERDNTANATVVRAYERALEANAKVPSLMKIYPGAAHGWTTRYNESDPRAVELANETHRDLLRWFRKYVK